MYSTSGHISLNHAIKVCNPCLKKLYSRSHKSYVPLNNNVCNLTKTAITNTINERVTKMFVLLEVCT